jgi:hypothetical protein
MISIIKQIQASITCEARWLRWVWRKYKRKAKCIIYTSKHQFPLKPRQIISSPSNQAIWVANIKFRTQEGSNQNTRFLIAKDHTPPEAKVNHKLIWPRHKSYKNKNNHQWSQAKPARHPQQENVDHHSNSSQNRRRNQPTKSHIYTGDEHHDGINMGHNQGTVTQSGKQIKPHKKQV